MSEITIENHVELLNKLLDSYELTDDEKKKVLEYLVKAIVLNFVKRLEAEVVHNMTITQSVQTISSPLELVEIYKKYIPKKTIENLFAVSTKKVFSQFLEKI